MSSILKTSLTDQSSFSNFITFLSSVRVPVDTLILHSVFGVLFKCFLVFLGTADHALSARGCVLCVRGGASCVPAVCRPSCVAYVSCACLAYHMLHCRWGTPSSLSFGCLVCFRVHVLLNHRSFDLCFTDRAVRNRPGTIQSSAILAQGCVVQFSKPLPPTFLF